MNPLSKGIFDRHPEIETYEVTITESWHENDRGKTNETVIKNQNTPADFRPASAGKDFLPFDILNFVCATAQTKESIRRYVGTRSYASPIADERYVKVSMKVHVLYKKKEENES